MWTILLFVVTVRAVSPPGGNGDKPPVGPSRPPGTGPWYPNPPGAPTGQCSVNETRAMCKNLCPGQTCKSLYMIIECNIPLPCTPGCDCKEGYYRNNENRCVLKKECPPAPWVTTTTTTTTTEKPSTCNCPCNPKPRCKANEVFLNCTVDCQNNYCPVDDKPILTPCELTYPCPPGCACKVGYRRRSRTDKTCIPAEDCPPMYCHRQNEIWDRCSSPCRGENCEDAGKEPTVCNTLIKNCQPRCVCKKGHYRNSSGLCVPVYQCNPKPRCKANEVFLNCTVDCQNNYCPVDDKPILTPCELSYPCPPGCACKVGYRRRSKTDKTCIPAEDCPPMYCHRQNEIWDRCSSPCRGENCEDADKEPTVCNTLIKNCQPKCVCKKGYYRGYRGACVPKKQCPQYLCSENEIYVGCIFDCPTIFCARSEYDALLACSPPYPCNPGCACKPNFKRRSLKDRTCIPIEDCPSVNCSGSNQVWNKCPSSCLDESCSAIDKLPTLCYEPTKYCQPKCTCAPGYYRNDENECVSPDKCPGKECGENEIYVPCEVNCPTEFCATNEYSSLIACSVAWPCPSGCACIKNFKRRSYEDRTCIPIKDCPPVVCSGQHEVWNTCPGCITENCHDLYKPTAVCTLEEDRYCQPRCVCEKGYYKNSSNVCVPASECPIICDEGANQTEVPCTFICPHNVCPYGDQKYACKPPRDCPKGCGCKLGYRYKSYADRTCILAEDCPIICDEGANQTEVPCTFICPHNVCPDSDSQNLFCKPPHDCPKGCGCKLGYRYKSYDDRTCILAEDCPEQPCTSRQNERWHSCPSCLAESCADAYTRDTAGVCNEFVHNCQPQCICKDGYFRNESGICVPKSECPIICDEGANQTEVFCTHLCPQNVCPDSDSQNLACKPPRDCPKGCGCKLGYRYKSYDDRTCILAEDCPEQPCTSRQNEQWHSCPSCLAEYCADAYTRDTAGVCNELVHNCQPQCICKDGYFRNESRICIPKSECPLQCGENQVEVQCAHRSSFNFCPSSDVPEYKNYLGLSIACERGCICADGYLYRSENDLTCVLPKECTPLPCTTNPNEEWDSCPYCRPEYCSDKELIDRPCAEFNCVPRCVCKKGYLRNESNICIPESKCTKCPPNERYARCKSGCPTDFCPENDNEFMIACDPPYPCPGGCICELNYRRKSYDNQTCIPVQECPPVNCTRSHEVWNPCTLPCSPKYCYDLGRGIEPQCEYLKYCEPRCVCEPGFLKNDNGECIPIDMCPTTEYPRPVIEPYPPTYSNNTE